MGACLHPPGREHLQPRGLGGGDRLVGRSEPAAAPGLDLTDDEHAPVAQHEVDLPGVAAPVAVEDDHALVGEVACGDGLAVGPE